MHRFSRAAFYVLLLAALLFVHLRLVDYAFDDAYIHLRIADHLVTDGVPYFNSGDPVMGSSSPLWTIVLGAIFLAFGITLQAASVLAAVASTGCVWVYSTLVARGAGRDRSSIGHDVAVAAVIVPLLALASVGVMETPFALLVAGIGMLLFQERQPAAFAFLALAAFVRVELAVVFIVFAATAIHTRRIRLVHAALYAAAGSLPLIAYELYFFGTLVPSAVHAKSRGYSLTAVESFIRTLSFWPFDVATLVGLIVGLISTGAILLLRDRVEWSARAAFASGVLILLTYVITRAFVFEWYTPLYTVLLAWPLAAVFCNDKVSTGGRIASAILLAPLALPAQLVFLSLIVGASYNPAFAATFSQGARVQSYIAIGRELFAIVPDSSLLTSEIGGLGYGYAGTLHDGFGLISPAALKYHPMRVPEERGSGTTGAIPPGYVRETRPALIVSYDHFAEALLRSDAIEPYVRVQLPPFRPREVALAEAAGVPLELWGIQTLEVFIRNDVYKPWMAEALRTSYSARR